MLLQNALFLFIPDIYIRGWTRVIKTGKENSMI